MFCFLGSALTAYMTTAGLVTTTAVAGRGLVHSVRLIAQGQYGEAGLQVLAALATPAVLAQAATAELLQDVQDTARELSGQTLRRRELNQQEEKAA